ncbi:MAG: prolipoprotein diacylglyceryl transferase [Proteobacteria bacterium]|nr:prolipoprotein diacylglyceryl transferase [Pseudomonadota bacterium]
MLAAAHSFLFIPWFRLEPWHLPIPFVGELPIQPFGVLVAIGILSGAKLAERRGRELGIEPALLSDFATHTVAAGLLCAFVLNGVFYSPERVVRLVSDPSWSTVKRYGCLGLSSYGGFMGAVLGGWIWRQRRGKSLLLAGDAGTFGFPLGWMFGRTGCFVVHDHPGVVTTFPLAVDNYHQLGQPRHDLGLYEVIWSAAATLLFLLLARKRQPAGTYMALFALLYGPIRFFLDFLREVPERGGDVRYAALTPGQYGSILLTLAGLGLLWRVRRGPEPALELGTTRGTDPAGAKAVDP